MSHVCTRSSIFKEVAGPLLGGPARLARDVVFGMNLGRVMDRGLRGFRKSLLRERGPKPTRMSRLRRSVNWRAAPFVVFFCVGYSPNQTVH